MTNWEDELDERFLTVRANLRTHRIHLEQQRQRPDVADDRYLCIVAARYRQTDRVFLPFDDDPTLSLILAKAFLLVEDDAIDDPSIADQVSVV